MLPLHLNVVVDDMHVLLTDAGSTQLGPIEAFKKVQQASSSKHWER